MTSRDEIALRLELTTWIVKCQGHLQAQLNMLPVFTDPSQNQEVVAMVGAGIDMVDRHRTTLETTPALDVQTLSGMTAEVAQLAGQAEAMTMGLSWIKALSGMQP